MGGWSCFAGAVGSAGGHLCPEPGRVPQPQPPPGCAPPGPAGFLPSRSTPSPRISRPRARPLGDPSISSSRLRPRELRLASVGALLRAGLLENGRAGPPGRTRRVLAGRGRGGRLAQSRCSTRPPPPSPGMSGGHGRGCPQVTSGGGSTCRVGARDPRARPAAEQRLRAQASPSVGRLGPAVAQRGKGLAGHRRAPADPDAGRPTTSHCACAARRLVGNLGEREEGSAAAARASSPARFPGGLVG